MNTVIHCVHCGALLHIAYWKDHKPFCDIHCLLNWQVVQDLKAIQAHKPQQLNLLHFTDDNPLTTEAL